jgi:periplasmic divalent cation tolerance protein
MLHRNQSEVGVMAHIQVQFTLDDPVRADAIVEQLLVDRLAACGQRVGPVLSRYWWEGSLVRAEEWLVLIKTRGDLAAATVEAIVAAHPYDTPEVVVLPIALGSPGYLSWIDRVTAAPATIGQAEETEEP